MKQFILAALLLCSGAFPLTAQHQAAISTLDALLRLADERSRSLKLLELGVEVAKSDLAVAKSAFLPDASLSASAGYNSDAWVCDRDFSHGHSFASPHFANSFGFEASMLLFAGGATINSIRAKELKSEIAKWNLEECRQQVYFLLASYYLDFCKSANLLAVLDKSIAQTRMMIEEMRAKADAGLALRNDVTRYRVQLQTLLYRRKEIESTAHIFYNRMSTTLGLPPETTIEPDTLLLSLKMPQLTMAGAQAMAGSNSPRLNRSALQQQLAERNRAVVRSGYYPHLRLYAGDSFKGPITYEIPTLDNNINVWYVGIGLSYNLAALYKAPKEMARLSAMRRQADAQLLVGQQEVALDVHDGFVRYLDAFELLRTQEATLQLASENYDTMANRYANGLVLATDLVDADNLRLSAEMELVNARIGIVYNYYKLLYAAGSIKPAR